MKLANWIAVASVVGLGTVAGIGAQGCTVTSGNGDFDGGTSSSSGGSSGSSGSSSGGPVSNTECAYCLYPACAGQYSVCSTQTGGECTAILVCAVACNGSASCVADCFNAHPSGQAAYRAYAACDTAGECGACGAKCPTERAAQSCPSGSSSGGSGSSSGSGSGSGSGGADASTGDDGGTVVEDAGSASACTTCQETSCASQYAACSSNDSDCAKYNECVVGCSDTACITKCGTDHGPGQTAATALGTCTATSCATACGL